MREVMRVVAGIVAILLFIMALGWLVEGNNFFMFRYWAPKYEGARRQTYEQTKSYRQGSTQRLGTLCDQVHDAVVKQDDGHKTMLNDIIKQEFVEWDLNDVPSHLRPCLLDARK